MTDVQDLVLIHVEDRPLTFARVEQIQPDHKPGWFHVELLLLQVPLQTVSWILRDVYIAGEPFTMGGKAMRLEAVRRPQDTAPKPAGPQHGAAPDPPDGPSPVIRLADRRKRRE